MLLTIIAEELSSWSLKYRSDAVSSIIVLIGIGRGLDFTDVLLLGTAMAISAIPTGLPTFVQGMLSYGSKQLAEAKAVVKNLTDVETLGSTSAINSDKTGTLTMNEMMASHIYHDGSWFRIEGSGYAKSGAILATAGEPDHDFAGEHGGSRDERGVSVRAPSRSVGGH